MTSTECFKCTTMHGGSHPWCQPCRDRVNKVYEAEERARAEAEELSAATYDSVAVSRARELLRVL